MRSLFYIVKDYNANKIIKKIQSPGEDKRYKAVCRVLHQVVD